MSSIRARSLTLLALFTLAALAACGAPTPRPAPSASLGVVQVLYGSSLLDVVNHRVAPAFRASTGYTLSGEANGSGVEVGEIKSGLRRPDVFITGAPVVNTQLMGPANGDLVSWYVDFARSEIVVAYSDHRRFAGDLRSGSSWYEALAEPGLRLGRTDPLADPKGIATIWTMELAERYYDQPGLRARVLGADENAEQIVGADDLLARLRSGQLDAGFVDIQEAKTARLPFVTLPDQVNQGDPALAATYATAAWTNPRTGQVARGIPLVFTVTIPITSQHPAGAIAFVRFLLSREGQVTLQQGGLLATPFVVSGDAAAVPRELRGVVQS
jgi:molybdate/tungstate transport system substrate-binding protein